MKGRTIALCAAACMIMAGCSARRSVSQKVEEARSLSRSETIVRINEFLDSLAVNAVISIEKPVLEFPGCDSASGSESEKPGCRQFVSDAEKADAETGRMRFGAEKMEIRIHRQSGSKRCDMELSAAAGEETSSAVSDAGSDVTVKGDPAGGVLRCVVLALGAAMIFRLFRR